MVRNHVLVRTSISCSKAIELMLSHGVRNIILLSKDDNLIGIVSMGDILRARVRQPFNDVELSVIANYNPVVGNAHMSNEEILKIMKEYNIIVVPIVKDKKVIDVVEIFDCL